MIPDGGKVDPNDRRTNTELSTRGPFRTIELAPVSEPGRVWERTTWQPQLRHHLLVLGKHKWLIVAHLLLVVTLVTIATFRARPVYEATARVEIDSMNQNFLPFQTSGYYESYWDTDNYIETRGKVLQSETLAQQTIRTMDLENNPEFLGDEPKSAQAASPAAAASSGGPQKKPAILAAFLSRLKVMRVRNSRLLNVRFEAYDPELAARILNAHLENFLEHNFRTRYESTIQASNWLTTQLEDMKVRVEKSEDALVTYERENQIWAIDERQNITTQKLSDLNQELTSAQGNRMQKESSYRLLRAGNLDAIPAVRESQLIRELLSKLSALRQETVEARAQFGPKYPKVLRLESQLQEMEQNLQQEKLNIVAGIESEYRTALERERLLTAALERQKSEANELAQKLVQYNILKREAETNKQLYDGLLQRIKEAGISAGLRSSNIRVVDPALIPDFPIRPRKMLNILAGLFVGLLGGVGIAFLREYLDNTIKTADDIEYLTHLPSLVFVPDFITTESKRQARRRKMLPAPGGNGQEHSHKLIAHESPRSPASEAFRALRTSLLLSRPGKPPQTILLTSALSGEGKTTAAINLAVTLAQLGDRTLLVDADLRKPSIGRIFGLGPSKHLGLSSYLAGAAPLEKVITPHPEVPNLAVMPAGPVPPNPAEMLSSQRLIELLASLREEFKFVIFDSPPVLSVTDAVVLSVLADCVLLIARSGETPKEALRRSKEVLAAVNSPLLGVVLNAVDLESPYYYYSYRYYTYGHSYGEEPAAERPHS